MTAGKRIRDIRKSKHLTQKQLGELAGIAEPTIRRYELEKLNPKYETLEKIAAALGVHAFDLMGIGDQREDMTCHEDRISAVRPRQGALQNRDGKYESGESSAAEPAPAPPLPPNAESIDFSRYHRIPILGRISAGLPIYAEQNIEGYTLTGLNGGGEYFALRVTGDSMNAIGINDGYLIIVRRQDEVENGEVAVVLVDGDDATVKRFYATDTTVTLMPQSTNPKHQPQIYDLRQTSIRVLGKVVKVEFTL